jgi:hypothetical protein
MKVLDDVEARFGSLDIDGNISKKANRWYIPVTNHSKELVKHIPIDDLQTPLLIEANRFLSQEFCNQLDKAIVCLNEGIYKADFEKHQQAKQNGDPSSITESDLITTAMTEKGDIVRVVLPPY